MCDHDFGVIGIEKVSDASLKYVITMECKMCGFIKKLITENISNVLEEIKNE